ncbi:MAG TPA: sigma-70 family RNA polymerase sigma factor [Polyangiaceae bacterium]|nr:sigma-70 family RNA polymerase sigma factor [Polyangiaceae bacterium]
MSSEPPAPELPDHYFRHEFGRLVAVLSRRFGLGRVEQCEDAAQTALLRALSSWRRSGVPDDKGAWLYRVAYNHLLDGLRRERRAEAAGSVLLAEPEAPLPSAAPPPSDDVYLEHEVKDDELRLLFVCADPAIARESQLVLALKILCGFSTEEIARRLFQSQEAVFKRLQRARATLRDNAVAVDAPPVAELAERLPAVLQMLYLLFNEGYSSADPDQLIRRELCEEAVRLARLLVEHSVGARPEVDALLALFYLHAARFDARVDGAGGLLLLEDQDRSLWDRELIEIGLSFLQRAARGEVFSRFHVEAAIAVEHCLAASYAETRWSEITRLYEALDRYAPSPLNTLNRAIALAEWRGPAVGLAALDALKPPSWLLGYYLWDATLGELYRRQGDLPRARRHLERALEAAPTHAEKALIRRRLGALGEAEG